MKLKIFLILIFSSAILYSGESGLFLNLPNSAKEIGIGGAMAGVNGDIDAINHNPAGLSKFNRLGLALFYSRQLFGNSYSRATIVHPLGIGTFGINFSYFYIPFDERFEDGAISSSINLKDINLNAGFQRDIKENFSIGIGVKFVSVDLGSIKTSTTAIDIGMLYGLIPERFNIGAGVRNIGLEMKFSKDKESLPITMFGGIMYNPEKLKSLNFYFEIDKAKGENIEFGSGIELSLFNNLLKPRIGYRIEIDRGILGAGIFLGGEIGNTILGLDYGIGIDIETIHFIEFKLSQPPLFVIKFGGEKIPYDGKNPSRIAISELKPYGCNEEIASTVSEWLRSDLANSSALSVLAREDMAKIFEEHELRMTGITSPEDAVEIGKILNVQYMITGSLSKVGEKYYINLKVVNIETGKVEAAAEEMAGSEATLRLAARRIAMKLDPASEGK